VVLAADSADFMEAVLAEVWVAQVSTEEVLGVDSVAGLVAADSAEEV
jgi:hypothetical protein